jgi:hypothetical protein
MTGPERRALLGDEVITHIHEEAALAPAPPSDLIERLRLVLTRPAGQPHGERRARSAA